MLLTDTLYLKVKLFAIFSGLSGVAVFVLCSAGQTEDYEAKPTLNEVWVTLGTGNL